MQDEILLTIIRLDLVIEALAGVMALMISHYANNAFHLTRQKKLSDISTGFLVLSAGMFGRVLGTLYFFVVSANPERVLTVVIIGYGVMKIMAYAIFVTSTHRGRSDYQPAVMAALVLPFLTSPELDMIAILLLVVVVLQTMMNYLSVRTKFALYVFIGFLLLLFSHVLGMVAVVDARTYIIYLGSQFAQFLGLLSFLVMLRQAQKDE